MLTFLRKIRKSLVASGNARKYLLYAVGEIALVVIGILIALQINNWNQKRIDRIGELSSLEQLKKAMKDQHQSIEFGVKANTRSIKSSLNVLDFLDEHQTYNDTLSHALKRVTRDHTIRIIENGYDKYQGQNISNDSLFWKIQHLYEVLLPRLTRGATGTLNIEDYFENYARKHFKTSPYRTTKNYRKEVIDYIEGDDGPHGLFNFTPIDYKWFREDEEFRYLVKRSIQFRTSRLRTLNAVLRVMDEIHHMIDLELGVE